jgi:hypothetical protein
MANRDINAVDIQQGWGGRGHGCGSILVLGA